jgi:HK97 family phage major capsid protein
MDKKELDKLKQTYQEAADKFKETVTKFEEKYIPVSEFNEKMTELNTKMDEIETKLNRPPTPQPPAPGSDEEKAEKAKVHKKAFMKYLRKGEKALTPEDYKVLTIQDDTTGGYLATGEMDSEIVRNIVEMSPIRSLARVTTTGKSTTDVPKKTGSITATWGTEIGNIPENTGLTFGLVKSTPNNMNALVKVSLNNLDDSDFNLQSEITIDMSEQFAVAEGTAFTTGDDVEQPEGILTNSSIGEVNSGHASTLLPDGLMALLYSLKEGYLRNANWLMNRSTKLAVRQMKDTTNQYLWKPGIEKGEPGLLLGYPVFGGEDMPNVGAGTYPIVFGDFRRGYRIVDRVGFTIQRLNELYAANSIVGFVGRKRVDGLVVLPEALKKQKVSA